MPVLPIPVDVESLPSGWYVSSQKNCLYMREAHVHILAAPDPSMRLRGPEWTLAVAWRVPVQLGPGIYTYDTKEIYADTDGYGFWGALREAVQDWCGEMPEALRERLLAEITPRAQHEAREVVAARAAIGGSDAR